MKATKRLAAALAATAIAAGGVVVTGGPALANREYSAPEAAKPGSNALRPGTMLESGDALMSTNDEFGLRQNEDGNLVFYRASDKKALFATFTSGHPGAVTRVNEDGNVVVYDPETKKPLWASNTSGRPASWLQVMNDGNLVLWGQDGTHQWTRWFLVGELKPGPTLSPNHYLASRNREYFLINQGTDGNIVLVNKKREALWATDTSGTKGAFARFQKDGNFVVIDPETRKAVASTDTAGRGGTSLKLGNDGNLIIQDRSGKAVWSSRTDQTMGKKMHGERVAR